MATSAGTNADAAPNETTTEAILRATLEVIGERGLRGATTRAIAQQADVNEVTLFRQFGTKANLIKQAILDKFAQVEREAVAYTGDLEADLIRLADYYVATMNSLGPVARAVLTEMPFEPSLNGLEDGPRRVMGAVGEMLSRYQADGVLGPEPIETLGPAFIAPILLPHVVRFSRDWTFLPIDVPFDTRAHVRRFLFGRAGTGRADAPSTAEKAER